MSLNWRADTRGGRIDRNERGQILVLFVVLIGVVFIIAAAAIDYGLWLSERRGIARASDMGALAAAQDMPVDPSVARFLSSEPCNAPAQPPSTGDACESARQWAERNGYGIADGATVDVTFFCGNNLPYSVIDHIKLHNSPDHRVCKNENCDSSGVVCSFPYLSPCPSENDPSETGCDAVNVTINKPAIALFGNIFGGVSFDVGFSSWGRITFKLLPTDSVLAIDESGSMNGGCNAARNNTGCRIFEAQNAAKSFIDYLINGSNITRVGFSPYRGCYDQYNIGDPPIVGSTCVGAMPLTIANCDTPPDPSQITCLNTDGAYATAKINAATPAGFTNICYGMFEQKAILDGPGHQWPQDPKTKRFAVILTDGDNFYNADPYNAGNIPPAACLPVSPAQGNSGGSCSNAQGTNERDLDVKTKALSDAMKAANIEVYVIGLAVCGANNVSQFATGAYCSGIGNANGDATADRRLLKCIASSTTGTNDHYYETSDATQLGNIFQIVALEIAGRGLSAESPP